MGLGSCKIIFYAFLFSLIRMESATSIWALNKVKLVHDFEQYFWDEICTLRNYILMNTKQICEQKKKKRNSLDECTKIVLCMYEWIVCSQKLSTTIKSNQVLWSCANEQTIVTVTACKCGTHTWAVCSGNIETILMHIANFPILLFVQRLLQHHLMLLYIFSNGCKALIYRTASTYFNCTTIFSTQTLMYVKLKEIMFNNGKCSLDTVNAERMDVAINSTSYAIEDEEVTKMLRWELGNMKTHTRYFIM